MPAFETLRDGLGRVRIAHHIQGRIRLRVDDWDTPWALQHGRSGMLMKGHFLNIELKEGVGLDIDAGLLERCGEQ